MTLKERINIDFMDAYKNKDMKKKDFLGVLKGMIQTNEGKQIISTDENVLKIIKSIEKGVIENIEGRKKSGLDVSEQELELSYIKPYQPTLMTEDEIRFIVKHIISVSTNKNQGFLMGTFNKENVGKAFDNKIVSKIIQEELV
jgi:uncharacterized protein YqeY